MQNKSKFIKDRFSNWIFKKKMFPSPIAVFHNIIQLHVWCICNKGVKITYSQFSLDYFTVQLLIRLSCMKGFKIDNYLYICTDAAQNSIILIFSTLYLSLLTVFFFFFFNPFYIYCPSVVLFTSMDFPVH